MSGKTKVWILAAVSVVLIVCILGGVTMILNRNSSKLMTAKYDVSEEFKDIQITTKTASIEFIPSEDGKTSIICHEPENRKHTVSVKDGVLVITLNDTRKWYEFIGIDFYSPKITVYLPQREYGNLNIHASTGNTTLPDGFTFEGVSVKASTGDISVNGIVADMLNLSVSTGNITVENSICSKDVKIEVSTGKTNLTNIQCKNLISDGDTGNITLTNVLASEKFDIERDTGKVRLNGCDAGEIYIETDTGSVTGTLLSEKVFITKSDTGKIDVPKTVTGGRCEIETDTGNIIITIK